jgi:hypothetical protein
MAFPLLAAKAMKAVQGVKAAKTAATNLRGTVANAANNIRQPVVDWRDNMLGQFAPQASATTAGAPVPQAGQTGWTNPNTAAYSAGGSPTGWDGNVDNIPGSGSRGNIQRGTMPEFLQDSPVGYMQQQLLASLMDEGGVSRQFLNQDLANIQSSTQAAQRTMLGNQRFRGSGVGQAVSAAMGAGGTAMQSRRLAQADEEELRRKLMVSEGMSKGFTNPLMQSLGMGAAGYDNMMARAAADAARPSGFERGAGMFTGLVGAFMCWVARAVLRDERWLDARIGLIHEGSPALLSAYLDNGQALACRVESDPALKAELTPVFEDLANRGAAIRLSREKE